MLCVVLYIMYVCVIVVPEQPCMFVNIYRHLKKQRVTENLCRDPKLRLLRLKAEIFSDIMENSRLLPLAFHLNFNMGEPEP